jgi:hypothetical protein
MQRLRRRLIAADTRMNGTADQLSARPKHVSRYAVGQVRDAASRLQRAEIRERRTRNRRPCAIERGPQERAHGEHGATTEDAGDDREELGSAHRCR